MPRTAQPKGLYDSHGRHIDYMRVSLTDRCNFRCLYCMPPDGAPFIRHEDILAYEEILSICATSAELGISRYKITGGEPFCRKGAAGFIRSLKALPGVEHVTLTTNGSFLSDLTAQLPALGVDAITVSLDTLNQKTFEHITRSTAELSRITAAMHQAAGCGISVKINVVPLQGINETELVALTRFGIEHGYPVRFIELMPMGAGAACAGMSADQVRRLLEQEFGPLQPAPERRGNGPAEYQLTRDGGVIGFIAPLSHRFCPSCNRVRLTSVGFLKTCLQHDCGTDLKAILRSGAGPRQLAAAIQHALRHKPLGHTFHNPPADGGQAASMNSIGG